MGEIQVFDSPGDTADGFGVGASSGHLEQQVARFEREGFLGETFPSDGEQCNDKCYFFHAKISRITDFTML